MKVSIITYYVLIMMLILGGFASMAQNDYGLHIMGWSSLGFCMSFILLAIRRITDKDRDHKIWEISELLGLTIIALLFFMRSSFIRFQYVEYLIILAGLAIVLLYVLRLYHTTSVTRHENRKLAIVLLFYYSSIILYTLSMVVVPLSPGLSEPFGGAGFAAIALSIIGAVYFRNFFYQSNKISLLDFLKRYKDRSLLMVVIYLIFTAYMGLTKLNIIPQLYSSEFPQAYIELVDKAESGLERPVNGVYSHEKYKESLDKFIERNADKK